MRGPEVLNYVWVFHGIKEAALLLEPSPGGLSPRVTKLEENGVQQLGGTGQ